MTDIREPFIRNHTITIIKNQPTATPNAERAAGTIEVRCSASASDLNAGPLELAEADELLPPVVPTIGINKGTRMKDAAWKRTATR
jgi:hypothetical protein